MKYIDFLEKTRYYNNNLLTILYNLLNYIFYIILKEYRLILIKYCACREGAVICMAGGLETMGWWPVIF